MLRKLGSEEGSGFEVKPLCPSAIHHPSQLHEWGPVSHLQRSSIPALLVAMTIPGPDNQGSLVLLCTIERAEKPMAGTVDWKGTSPTPASTFVSALRAERRMREPLQSLRGVCVGGGGPYLANDACKEFMFTGQRIGEMSQTPSS